MKKLAILTAMTLLASSLAFGSNIASLKSDSNEVINELLENEEDIAGVDLLVAGSYPDGPVYSRWGHAFLVFVSKKEKRYYNNIALSFVADTSDPKDSVADIYVKGLTGAYDLKIEADYFYYFWEKHIVNEGRPLERIMIPLNEKIKKDLFHRLAEVNKNPKLMGNYKFITNNCIAAASSFLKSSGIPVGDTTIIPVNAGKNLSEANVTPFPVLKVNSPNPNIGKISGHLKKKKITTYNQFTNEVVAELVDNFGADSTFAFIQLNQNLSLRFSGSFLQKYGHLLNKTAMSDSFIPMVELYSLCEDEFCAEIVAREEKASFRQDLFSENALARHLRSFTNKEQNAYSVHSKLLVEAQKKSARRIELMSDEDTHTRSSVDIMNVEGNQAYLTLNTRSTSYSLKIFLERNNDMLFLQDRPCIDTKTLKFTKNCGLISEQKTYSIIAY